MYESPIKIIYGQMQTQIEGDILKAVMRTDIQVDKEELTHALRYDRDQYERGFADGYMKAQQEVVHGEWNTIEDDYVSMTALECSVCNQEYWFEDEPPMKIYNYCPNCGAKMDLGSGHE